MHVYNNFVWRLLRNYLFGSFISIFGVGLTFVFTTVPLGRLNLQWVIDTMLFCVLIMIACETIAFRKHLFPIRKVYKSPGFTRQELQDAFLHTHRFPFLSINRILGPHLLGLSIPYLTLTICEMQAGVLVLPYRYLLVATIGAVLIAGMHAMIEFFLTTEALQPLLNDLRTKSIDTFGVDPSLNGAVPVSIRKKFVWSAMLIGTFPLLLFGFAAQVRLSQLSDDATTAYWRWAAVILLFGICFAWFSARLMSRAVTQPIEHLQDLMRNVQQGNLEVRAQDLYSDDFSRLISGFNHMVSGLRMREEWNKQLLNSYFTTLAAALDARDPYTAGHSIRVATFSVQIGQAAGLTPAELDLLKKSALLHDIGKIGIRDNVLLKDGRLTDDEFAQIKMHPELGEAILKQIQPQELMAPLLPGVRSHHERYDGQGYPDGLQGEQIPIFGRIIAVADAFDAMTSDRPYRQGMPQERALLILEEGSGSQWDPVFASLFVDWVRTQEAEYLREVGAEKRLEKIS